MNKSYKYIVSFLFSLILGSTAYAMEDSAAATTNIEQPTEYYGEQPNNTDTPLSPTSAAKLKTQILNKTRRAVLNSEQRTLEGVTGSALIAKRHADSAAPSTAAASDANKAKTSETGKTAVRAGTKSRVAHHSGSKKTSSHHSSAASDTSHDDKSKSEKRALGLKKADNHATAADNSLGILGDQTIDLTTKQALFDAVRSDERAAQVIKMFKENVINPNLINEDGETLMAVAIRYMSPENVKSLMRMGAINIADTNAELKESLREYALNMAYIQQHKKNFRLLLKRIFGIDSNLSLRAKHEGEFTETVHDAFAPIDPKAPKEAKAHFAAIRTQIGNFTNQEQATIKIGLILHDNSLEQRKKIAENFRKQQEELKKTKSNK